MFSSLCFGQGTPNPYVLYPAASCTADPNEQYTGSDAAADPNCTESNAVDASWVLPGAPDNASITSQSTTVNVGTYALEIERVTANVTSYVYYPLSATSGDTFTVSWDEIQTVGTTGVVTNWANCSGGPSFDSVGGTWGSESYNITATATGTIELRFYVSNGGAINDKIIIDNLSIIKTN